MNRLNLKFAAKVSALLLPVLTTACASAPATFEASVQSRVESDLQSMTACGAKVQRSTVASAPREEQGWFSSLFGGSAKKGAATDVAAVEVTYKPAGKCDEQAAPTVILGTGAPTYRMGN